MTQTEINMFAFDILENITKPEGKEKHLLLRFQNFDEETQKAIIARIHELIKQFRVFHKKES
jgi:hypothetical protein